MWWHSSKAAVRKWWLRKVFPEWRVDASVWTIAMQMSMSSPTSNRVWRISPTRAPGRNREMAPRHCSARWPAWVTITAGR